MQIITHEIEGREKTCILLGDESMGYNPGYSFHGRMMALAQVDGMMAVVKDELQNKLL